MSIMYGVIMALLAYVNWHADTVTKRLVLQLLVATISLVFGVFAGKGY